MNDHLFFLWTSFAVFGIALVAEVILLRARVARSKQLKDGA